MGILRRRPRAPSPGPPRQARSAARSRTGTARAIYELNHAVERIAAAREAADGLGFPFTLTARAENFLHDNPDLDDTIARLQAYERAGADVLYAPGLGSTDQIRSISKRQAKLNVLARSGLSMHEMAEAALPMSVGSRFLGCGGRHGLGGEAIRDSGDFPSSPCVYTPMSG